MTQYAQVRVLVVAQLDDIRAWIAAGKTLTQYHRTKELPVSYTRFVRVLKRYLEKPNGKPTAGNPTKPVAINRAVENKNEKPKPADDPGPIRQFNYSTRKPESLI